MKQLIYSELIIGAGNCKDKKIFLPGKQAFSNVTTLDIDPLAKPDVLWDLNVRPLPFKDEQFDEIHAYEVLEHIGLFVRLKKWRNLCYLPKLSSSARAAPVLDSIPYPP